MTHTSPGGRRAQLLYTGLAGAALLMLVVIAELVSSAADLSSTSLLFGACLGAAVGLVPRPGPLMRLAGFALGILVSWIMFAVQAALLPDVVASRVIASAAVILIVTLISLVSGARVPLWSLLAGTAAMLGAYQEVFAAAPYDFIASSIATVGSLLLAAAIGLLAASAAAIAVGPQAAGGQGPAPAENIQDDPSASAAASPAESLPIFDVKG